MIPDAIEKEILIDAPADTVYRVITEPAQIVQWFADVAELDAAPGGEGKLTFEDRATSQRMAVRLRVTESGFTALQRPEEDKATYINIHDKGWDAHLANLQDYVTRQS